MVTSSSHTHLVPAETFAITYRLTGNRADAEEKATALSVEQTIEFPADLVWVEEISRHIIARVVQLREVATDVFDADLVFSADIAGTELTQLLNVLFGNASLLPGVRLQRFAPGPGLLSRFRGPRHGVTGLRNLVQAPTRPLLCTALKPMGLTCIELADLAGKFALGGADFIKDDHGLADQCFSPFLERVKRCSEAVERANRTTGGRCLYLPNVTAPAGEVVERARAAKAAGAGGLLLAPGIVGFDAMRRLADDDELALPILNHPAFQGGFVVRPDHGIAHSVLFGQVARLAGADGSIFPNYGGRFSFSKEECLDAAAGCREPLGGLAPILPVPAGGMKRARLEEMVDFYGNDVMLLIGGDLHRHPAGLTAACAELRQAIELL
jgi:ribulose-bisphosphate carboxylase large chain